MLKMMEARMSRLELRPSSVAPLPCCSCSYGSSSNLVSLRRPLKPSSQLKKSPRRTSTLASIPWPQSPRPLWPIRIPRPLVYSTNLADVDPVQLSELWEKTLKVTREPSKIMKALRHSFMEKDNLGLRPTPKVVGIGRAVSDGAFIATICDVAVDPEYQKQGIGRRIVKRLVQEVQKKGGPSGFAVFPPPIARRFFLLIGFRCFNQYIHAPKSIVLFRNSVGKLPFCVERIYYRMQLTFCNSWQTADRKFRLMGYQGKEEDSVPTANVHNGSLTSETEES